MRRAILRIAVLVLALTFVGQGRAGVSTINGIGLVDYATPQRFTPGTWVKYRVEGGNTTGESASYDVTVLIAANENFWGDDGFWVETHTQPKDGVPGAVATLMSYSIFEDKEPIQRMKYYMRKSILDFDSEGKPRQDVVRRPVPSMRSRSGPGEDIRWDVDTVGVDTVQTPVGLFDCKKVTIRQGLGATADHGDSTIRTESRDNRTIYMTPKVPITHIAREEIENLSQRKTWRIGRSQDAPFVILERSLGNARLIGFGTGMKSSIFTDDVLRAMDPLQSTKPKPKPKG